MITPNTTGKPAAATRGGSITTRLVALLTLCAAVIIGLGTLVDYRLTRDELLERLRPARVE